VVTTINPSGRILEADLSLFWNTISVKHSTLEVLPNHTPTESRSPLANSSTDMNAASVQLVIRPSLLVSAMVGINLARSPEAKKNQVAES
jgi:hypothetical protein